MGVRSNMEYLLTVVEERHRNASCLGAAEAGGLDIRFSVKDTYRKFFLQQDPTPNDEIN